MSTGPWDRVRLRPTLLWLRALARSTAEVESIPIFSNAACASHIHFGMSLYATFLWGTPFPLHIPPVVPVQPNPWTNALPKNWRSPNHFLRFLPVWFATSPVQADWKTCAVYKESQPWVHKEGMPSRTWCVIHEDSLSLYTAGSRRFESRHMDPDVLLRLAGSSQRT